MTSEAFVQSNRPNIVVILADDMGFSDIGCFGSEIQTPALDSMAKKGVRFTQMYNCARCCPTRASLLTGLYPHQAGVGHMIQDRGVGPAYQGFLRDDCVTIGEALQEADYCTCYAGKWHASSGIPLVGDPVAEPGEYGNPYPVSRGFERFYGTLAGAGSYYYPHALMEQDRRIEPDSEDFYYTDAISEKACGMIEEADAQKRPFFLHVCYTAPHWPLHARPEDIERYRGKYRKGWDYFRTARHEELKGAGALNPKWEISARDSRSHDFLADSPERQDWEDLRMAVYAAQVECMDRGIGQILQTLRQRGLEENTLVLFLSDNGGCAEFLREDGEKNSHPGRYQFSGRPGQTVTVGNTPSIQPGPADTFMSYDLPWANVSNAPFRLYKHWVHEGGISAPCVAQWPEKVANPGGFIHRPCHVVDIMSTCLEAAGAAYPTEFKGRPIQPTEGESFLTLLEGKGTERDCPLFWEHEGNAAMRAGPWKLVRKYPGDWELYNMDEDRTELRDLSHGDKDRLRRMAGEYATWAERCGVVDWSRVR